MDGQTDTQQLRRTGFHGLAESVVDDDRFGRDGSSRLHQSQRSFFWLRQQLMKSLTAHVDGSRLRLQRDQQLVRVTRRRNARLQSDTS